MGYGAGARVQLGIRTEVEPVWIHTPSLAPVSLPFTMLGPLPCAHLAQNPPSRWDPNALFYPDSKHRVRGSAGDDDDDDFPMTFCGHTARNSPRENSRPSRSL